MGRSATLPPSGSPTAPLHLVHSKLVACSPEGTCSFVRVWLSVRSHAQYTQSLREKSKKCLNENAKNHEEIFEARI